MLAVLGNLITDLFRGCASVIARFWFLHSLLTSEPFMRKYSCLPCSLKFRIRLLIYLGCISKLGLATILELGTGILAACLATMKPLLLWISGFIDNIRSSLYSTSVRWTGKLTTRKHQEHQNRQQISDQIDDPHTRTGLGTAMYMDGLNISKSTQGTERLGGDKGMADGCGKSTSSEHWSEIQL